MARRSGLGRGLGALIPAGETPVPSEIPAVGIEQGPFREVPIDEIKPNTLQPRSNLDEAQLVELSASIKELGVLQPLLVREVDNGYELIAGERRWRASRKAGLTTVPVIVRDSDDVGALERALVENLHRKDLNPLDEASAYQQLINDFSMTHDQVGKRVGRSRAAITNLLRLLQLQPKVQKLLMEDRISEGHARALLALDDQPFQLQLATRIAVEGLSVRAIEEAARLRKELERPKVPSQDRTAQQSSTRSTAAALEWQERIAASLDTRVTVDLKGKRGKIVIEVADEDDLDRVSSFIVGASRNARVD